jgi:hypothetical protein
LFGRVTGAGALDEVGNENARTCPGQHGSNMTSYGKINLAAIVGMPAAATLAAALTPALASPYAATFATVYAMNLVVMLVGGLGAALLLRGASRAGGRGAWLALTPSLVPALLGAAWYLYRGVVPEDVAPGREILAGPQYLLLLALALWIVAWIAGRIVRARPATA